LILTHIGGPTVLIELDGWRLLTDPTFDAPGEHYAFGWGTSSDKLAGPALGVEDLPPIDAVLLTHDHHADNLDTAGRRLLSSAGTVMTTVSGARRLGTGARGLAAGRTTRLVAPGKPALDIVATPARHGPPLSWPVVGDVVGFALSRSGGTSVAVWVTGDTVLSRRVRTAAAAMEVDVLVVHVGGVRFPITGPLRYTMTGRRAVELIDLVGPRVAVPVHYEGWSHFKDGRPAIERALSSGSGSARQCTRWLVPGSPADVG
jgi:L-ascorbate metabolism protein UlaG (beta-lactamase superfamily)